MDGRTNFTMANSELHVVRPITNELELELESTLTLYSPLNEKSSLQCKTR